MPDSNEEKCKCGRYAPKSSHPHEKSRRRIAKLHQDLADSTHFFYLTLVYPPKGGYSCDAVSSPSQSRSSTCAAHSSQSLRAQPSRAALVPGKHEPGSRQAAVACSATEVVTSLRRVIFHRPV